MRRWRKRRVENEEEEEVVEEEEEEEGGGRMRRWRRRVYIHVTFTLGERCIIYFRRSSFLMISSTGADS